MDNFDIQDQSIAIERLDDASTRIREAIREAEKALDRISIVRKTIMDIPEDGYESSS